MNLVSLALIVLFGITTTQDAEMARQLSEKYPRNNLFKLQMTDALNHKL